MVKTLGKSLLSRAKTAQNRFKLRTMSIYPAVPSASVNGEFFVYPDAPTARVPIRHRLTRGVRLEFTLFAIRPAILYTLTCN